MSILEKIIVFSVLVHISVTKEYVLNNKPFPKERGFSFGTATAAYQVEGAWNEDGKGDSCWDYFTHTFPNKIVDSTNGDIACDSYHKYKEDVALLKDIGVTHQRFSISWPRVLPNGLINQINQKGIDFYRNFIKLLKENGINPVVTLSHWDLPHNLQMQGGFQNNNFPDWFGDYARLCFENFGDDVEYWITFNEPTIQCAGYGRNLFMPNVAAFAPGYNLTTVGGEYVCMHNLIRAHSVAYHIYQKEFKHKQNGKLTIAHAASRCYPVSESKEDLEASDRCMQFSLGWVLHPIYYGDYPEVMKERIDYRSKLQGFSQSRLPKFTLKERLLLRKTSDYVAINAYYTTYGKNIPEPDLKVISLESDAKIETSLAEGIRNTEGMEDLLLWVHNEYGKPDIFITENGLGLESNSLIDEERVNFIKNGNGNFLQHSLSRFRDAMDKGVTLLGYTVWSLLDNFEWFLGYTVRYGLFEVDFNSPNRTRIARNSAGWFKQFIEVPCVHLNCCAMATSNTQRGVSDAALDIKQDCLTASYVAVTKSR
ncbi:myrosinase 1-like [Diorhabda sublineata]|uniref:myrosinase 1-like n=1 Tax=Diorhabda sublineata TaxID=1163346 RepID=UPI0024E194C5|nr:myrosinase 1-like [Diorhabda sublineata]